MKPIAGMSEKPAKLTARDMHALLRAHYHAPQYAYLAEVRSRTGYSGAIRTADAMVMGLWPSRGLELEGIEIKVSRHDWQRELADPAKAEEIQRFCHRWWIAASSEQIVKPDELPPTWGLLVPGPKRGGGMVLRVVVPAPLLTPTPPSYAFLAGLLRNAAETMEAAVPCDELDERIMQARKEADEHWRAKGDQELLTAKADLDLLRTQVNAFENHAGLRIDRTDVERIGDAVALVLAGGLEIRRRDLVLLQDRAEAAALDLARHVGDLDKVAALAAYQALPFDAKLADRAQGAKSGRPPEDDSIAGFGG